MHQLPEIANPKLQPLEIPGGRRVIVNHFYELDPDEDLASRELLHIESDAVTDPWSDVLVYYFDHSWLWRGTRNDNRYRVAVEWTPMGKRDGRYVVQQHRGTLRR